MADEGAGSGRAHPRPEISFEEIAAFPLPGTSVPAAVAFGPGDRVLAFVHDASGGLDRALWVVDLDDSRLGGAAPVPLEVPVVAGGVSVREADLSLEERLRRERTREVGLGVTTAVWADEADVLLVPLPSGLHAVSGLAERPSAAPDVRLVVPADDGAGAIVGPKLSPDGTMVAFSRGGDLWVAGTAAAASPGPTVRLSSTAADGLANGVAEFVAQEEMDRPDGLWWSKDSRWIAYAEVDERHMPVYRIVHQGSDAVGPGAEEDHRYPFPGAANAHVRLGVVPAAGGDTVWMDTGEEDHYLARVHWTRDGRLVVEIESRDQSRIDVVSFDPATGTPELLHREEASPFPYVRLHDDFAALADGGYLWSSERTGYRHLERRSATGELVAVLTAGEWQVDRLEGVDEERRLVYFTGTRDGPTERHLYVCSLDGPPGDVHRVTAGPGTHQVVVGDTCSVFVDRFASLASPPALTVRRVGADRPIAVLHDRRDPRIDELALEPPELVSFPAEDGTTLHGLLYRPEAPSPPSGAAPPLVVWVYGGPHAQYAVDDWLGTVQLRAQALRRLGFTVLQVDNRGSARRGLAFECQLHHRLGTVEVADQVAGVRWVVDQGLADPDRVAIYGWSYGGYMALRCLELAPRTFRAAIAGAPVTDWDGYDTHYTERYMGTPQEFPEEYRESSALARAGTIEGDLLLVHGLIDENVHFRHTARLINRLVAARKAYRLLCFPDERHLPRKPEDRAYMEAEMTAWLLDALGLSAGRRSGAAISTGTPESSAGSTGGPG